jgi:hypothetical protein
MKKIELRRGAFVAGVLAGGCGLIPAVACADWFSDIDVGFGGFVRQETAFRTTGLENPNNQGGNYFNDRTISREAFLPPAFLPVLGGTDGLLPGLTPGGGTTPPGTWGSVPLPQFNDEVRRGDTVPSVRNDFNYMILRAETEVGITFSQSWRFIARLRAIYDPTVYDEFDARSVADSVQGALDVGPLADPRIYTGAPNYFDYRVTDGAGGFSRANPLEWTGRDYQLYFPAMLLEYNSGDFAVRVGNQQIAWGQSIFFRVFDLPNGLDLRRHLVIDRALEEFSDKRVPMLSARATYQLTDGILADGYVGKFQPTVFGNPNTGYNVIPVQFTVHDLYKAGGFDDELVYGLRLKGDYGQWGFQAAAVRRYGPEGTFRWTNTRVNKNLVGPLGNMVNQAYDAKAPEGSALCPTYDPATCRRFDSTGEALANAPFQASPGGVYSADEWFRYAAEVRLDGIIGLNAAIREFEGPRDVYASEVENFDQAFAQLNTFFIGSGDSLRGHIERVYHRENVFGLGLSYVNESDNDFLNQLIFNLEVQYTPERTFTNIGLQQAFIKQDEYVVSLVIDKWHRFFNEFPGTYIVFQALTKNRSDLVGRHLSGYGGLNADQLRERAARGIVDTRSTLGKNDNATYVVFGFLQLGNRVRLAVRSRRRHSGAAGHALESGQGCHRRGLLQLYRRRPVGQSERQPAVDAGLRRGVHAASDLPVLT